jgi:hypothetical protein
MFHGSIPRHGQAELPIPLARSAKWKTGPSATITADGGSERRERGADALPEVR